MEHCEPLLLETTHYIALREFYILYLMHAWLLRNNYKWFGAVLCGVTYSAAHSSLPSQATVHPPDRNVEIRPSQIIQLEPSCHILNSLQKMSRKRYVKLVVTTNTFLGRTLTDSCANCIGVSFSKIYQVTLLFSVKTSVYT